MDPWLVVEMDPFEVGREAIRHSEYRRRRESLPRNPAQMMNLKAFRISVVTKSGGRIYLGDVVPMGTMTDVWRAPAAPQGFALEQNYPSPFNPTTTLRYSIGVDSREPPAPRGTAGLSATKVSLVLYDLLGREVAVLVNEMKPPGRYYARWDAAGLPSGVYLCRMTAGHFTETKKMILAR
jgi:hypothetical protein